jgi:hypothetical protein
MADKTPFADLMRLDPQDPLSTDGFAFQSLNPLIIDRLLRVGARDHRHDGHAPLADPTEEPVVDLAPTSGTIGPGEEVAVTYTLVDTYGGETLGAPVGTYSTPDPIEPPTTEPEVEVETLGGTILPGSVFYGMTYTDDQGGETDIGVPIEVVVDPGSATNKITLSGLSAIVAEAEGATGWRLYKSTGVSRYHFLASGSSSQDQVIDDGNLCVDCTEVPPTENNTLGFNAITVNVPDSVMNTQAGVVAYRIYVALGGDFESPSLLDQQLIATLGDTFTYDTLATEVGRPPDVSSSLAGAAKIDPDTDILDWHFKRPVPTFDDLPEGEQGDMRVTLSDGRLWIVLDAEGAEGPLDWAQIRGDGSSSGVGHEIWNAGVAMPDRGILDIHGPGVTVTDDPGTGRTIVLISGGGSGTGGFEGAYVEDADVELAIPDDESFIETPVLAVAEDAVIGEDTSFPRLELWLTHPAPSDLRGWLVHPDGTRYRFLSANTGANGLGSAFGESTRCVITPDADLSIINAFDDAEGEFTPDGDWSSMLGKIIVGDWKLRFQDTWSPDAGTLEAWGLRFTAGSPDHGSIGVNTRAGIDFNEDSAEGPTRTSLYPRQRQGALSNEDYWVGAWPDADYWLDESNGSQFSVAGDELVPTTLAEKRLVYTGFMAGSHWLDDWSVTARFEIQATHAADWGEFAVGLVDEDGNEVFGSIGDDHAGLRLYRKMAGEAEVQITESAVGAPPVGEGWLKFGRSGDEFYVERYEADPTANAYVDRRTWTPSGSLAILRRKLGYGFNKRSRPKLRMRPGHLAGVTYLGAPGMTVSGRGLEYWSYELWVGWEQGEVPKARPLFEEPQEPATLTLAAGFTGELKSSISGNRAYLEGTIQTTNDALGEPLAAVLPPELRPEAAVNLAVPLEIVGPAYRKPVEHHMFSLDTAGLLQRFTNMELEVDETAHLYFDQINWRVE